jgi:hypothetical protein
MVAVDSSPAIASEMVSSMSNGVDEPVWATPTDSTMTPTISPMSANFVVRNALLAASWFGFSCQ